MNDLDMLLMLWLRRFFVTGVGVRVVAVETVLRVWKGKVSGMSSGLRSRMADRAGLATIYRSLGLREYLQSLGRMLVMLWSLRRYWVTEF